MPIPNTPIIDVTGRKLQQKKGKIDLEKMKKLTNKEVEMLYKKYPEIEDPYYPSKVIRKHGELLTLEIKVGRHKYLVKSSPYTGDTWWKVL